MITRYSLLRGRFIEDKHGTWVIHADHVHEVARAIDASEARNRRFAAEIDALKAALRELVDTKDLHDRLNAMLAHCGDTLPGEYLTMRAEYATRRDLAWSAARAALEPKCPT